MTGQARSGATAGVDTGADLCGERQVPRLRERNMRIGLVVSGALLLAHAAYILATLDQPYRLQLAMLQLVAIGVGILAVSPARGRFGARLAGTFSTLRTAVFWAGSQSTLLLLAVALDGGLTSPITPVVLVPLLIGALSFSRRVVGLYTLANIAGVYAVGAATGTLTPGTAIVLPTVVAAVAMVATTAGRGLWELTSRLDRANAELAVLARTDPLTGSLNHRSFHERLAEALEPRGGDPGRPHRAADTVSLLLLDVDHFKRINDRYGHPTGDEVLIAIADTIRDTIRDGDLLGRTGGEEFAVLLPGTDLATAAPIAERIRVAFGGMSGVPEPITVSIGIAVGRAPQATPATLLRASDRAMYDAKDAGRDRVIVARHQRPDRPRGAARPQGVSPTSA